MTTDSETMALLCLTHRSLVFRICRRILGNDEDAEDATQEVFERAARYLQGKDVEKPSAYLTTVAQNTAHDVLARKLKRLETTALPDDLVPAQTTADEAEERLTLIAAEQLAAQMAPFLTARQQQRLRIRIAAGLGQISEDEAAAALGVKTSSLHATDARMSEVLTDAAIAARMTAAPTCEFVARIVRDEQRSRAMWKKIQAHLESCEECTERKANERRKVRETLYAMPGFLVVPTKTFALKKALVAAGVSAAACLTVAVINTSPFATKLPGIGYAAPKTSISVAAAAPPAPATTAASQPVSSPSAAKPSAPPSPRQQNNAPAAPAAPPPAGPSPASRADTPLTITAGPDAIENSTINTMACTGPTTSAIRVQVTPSDNILLVRLAMVLNGKTQSVPMRNTGGTTWVGTVGPYPPGTPGGSIRVAAVAMDRSGSLAERYIGTVMLVPCG